jgi:REP-associated tyrosine transposase
MVIGYHIIITNYGFWLPNDPRGSWSDCVRAWEIFLAGGPATKVTTRRSVAAKPHDYRQRQAVKESLVRSPVVYTGEQARAVGVGFAECVARSRFAVHACSIMPQHTHLVINRPPYDAEKAANLLKGAATNELTRRGLHPFADAPYKDGKLPTPWARKQWIVYLDCDADMRRAIAYVERNPLKDGLKPQHWSFITPYV